MPRPALERVNHTEVHPQDGMGAVARRERAAGRTLALGEEPRHPRLFVRRVVAMNSMLCGGFVDGGGQLLGCLSSYIGVAGGDGFLKALEVRLDGRLVAQVLQPLPLGDADPLALLLGISQSSILPSSLQSRSSLA
jgi:hypothetical protein